MSSLPESPSRAAVDEVVCEIDVLASFSITNPQAQVSMPSFGFMNSHLDALLLKRRRRSVPRHGRNEFAARERLLDRGHIRRVGAEKRALLAQLRRNLVEVGGRHIERADAGQEAATTGYRGLRRSSRCVPCTACPKASSTTAPGPSRGRFGIGSTYCPNPTEPSRLCRHQLECRRDP